MSKKFHFCACVGDYFLKMHSKTLRRKLQLSLLLNQTPWSFAIELTLVEMFKSTFIMSSHKHLGLDQENVHQYTDQVFDIVIFHYHLVSRCKLPIHATSGPSDLSVGVYTETTKQEGLHRHI